MQKLSIFFFFSSRRRHTRSKRDWSSEVCSSDLLWIDQVPITLRAKAALELPHADAERVTCIEKAGAFARRQLEHRVQCFARGDQALPHAQLESQCRLRRDGALGEASDMRGERKQHRIPENLRVADC